MTDNVSSTIVPDYTKPVAELYLLIAQLVIRENRSLSILSSVQRANHDEFMRAYSVGAKNWFNEKAPSWVPQWHYGRTQTLSPAQPHPSFAAASGRTLEWKAGYDDRILTVRGILVDRVEVSSSTRDDAFSAPYPEMLRRQHEENCLPTEFRYTKADLEDIALTLTGGKSWYGLPVSDTSAHLADFASCLVDKCLQWSLSDETWHEARFNLQGLVEMLTAVVSPSSFVDEKELRALAQGGTTKNFLDAAATVCKNRARFRTSTGMIGIGPQAMEEGDYVCVLYGAPIPFVIRKRGESYILIGECYVRDIMNGEAVQKVLDPDNDLEESWIELS